VWYLRRRARLTQREPGLRISYSEGHLCRFEQNSRLPKPAVLVALFVPALRPDRDPPVALRPIKLARQARGGAEAPIAARLPVERAAAIALVAPRPGHWPSCSAVAVHRAVVMADCLIARFRPAGHCGQGGSFKSD